MQKGTYIYACSYNINEIDLCKMEVRQLMGAEESDKQFVSKIKFDPSCSGFIKKRFDVQLFSEDYADLLVQIADAKIQEDGFKVEYLVLAGDSTSYAERLKKVGAVGAIIEGIPDFKNPHVYYSLCYCEGYWCFGRLHKNNYLWKAHLDKPQSFSNSINIKIAKSLVNLASGGSQRARLIDACCGVGTVLLEACFANVSIVGCDINWRVCVKSRENLSHFGYNAIVIRSDINDVEGQYDAAIVDLPYNLFSNADINTLRHILKGASKVASRLVIVSTTDISVLLDEINYIVLDSCKVKKRGKKHFERHIWLCERV